MARADNAGLGLFDDAASAAGNFPGALRGYDRQAVDDYVRTLESSVVQSRAHAAELEKQVTSLQDELRDSKLREIDPNDVDYAGLGGRANEILRLAQEQATDLTAAATLEGERIREEARRDAEHQRDQAERDSGELRSGGLNEIGELRGRLQEEVAAQVARAQAEAAALLDAARREAETMRLSAAHDASSERQSAQLDSDALRREVEREVADARADLAREREEGLAQARNEHAELTAQTRAMLTEATEHHAQSTGRLEADIAESARIRTEAVTEADQLRGNAIAEAENRLATARKQAAAITARTQQEFSWRKQQLRRETELLQQRKQAVLSQLASLSDLAQQTASSFPDLDEDRDEEQGSPSTLRSGAPAPESVDVDEDGSDRTILKSYPSPTLPDDQPPASSQDAAVQPAEDAEVQVADAETTQVEVAAAPEEHPEPEADGDDTLLPAGSQAEQSSADDATETASTQDEDELDIPIDGEPTLLKAPTRPASTRTRTRRPKA